MNRGDQPAPLDLLPTVWFRNTWSWGRDNGPRRRACAAARPSRAPSRSSCRTAVLGARTLTAEGSPQLLFVENETNRTRVFGAMASGRYVKDGINDFVVHGRLDAVNPAEEGTKASARYHVVVNPGETFVIKLRLWTSSPTAAWAPTSIACSRRAWMRPTSISPRSFPSPSETTSAPVMRQAIAGLLWSKQFYHYIVREWLEGDPASPAPPPSV